MCSLVLRECGSLCLREDIKREREGGGGGGEIVQFCIYLYILDRYGPADGSGRSGGGAADRRSLPWQPETGGKGGRPPEQFEERDIILPLFGVRAGSPLLKLHSAGRGGYRGVDGGVRRIRKCKS